MLEMGQVVTFEGEDGDEDFYVLDNAALGGKNYILVVDHKDGDALSEEALETDGDGETYASCDALILEEIPGEDGDEVTFQIVEDDGTLAILAELFQKQIENFEIDLSGE